MTNGQRAIMRTRRYLGHVESPWGSNLDEPGGVIRRSQAGANTEHCGGRSCYNASPWCAELIEQMLREEGIDDRGLLHPYTGDAGVGIWNRVKAFGLERLRPPAGKPYPAGCLIIKPDVHVEQLVSDLGGGAVAGIGGNVNNGVRFTKRDVGEWTILCPPWVLEGEAEPVSVYWFEVPALEADRFGGWPTIAQREEHIAEHVPPAWRNRVRRVRQAPPKQPFAYDLVPEQPAYDYLVSAGHSRDWLERTNRNRAAQSFTKATGLAVRLRGRKEDPRELAVDLEDLVIGGTTR